MLSKSSSYTGYKIPDTDIVLPFLDIRFPPALAPLMLLNDATRANAVPYLKSFLYQAVG
jgi:hypothetical protein